MKYAAYVSTYLLEFSQVIKLLFYLQFLKSKLQLSTVKLCFVCCVSQHTKHLVCITISTRKKKNLSHSPLKFQL